MRTLLVLSLFAAALAHSQEQLAQPVLKVSIDLPASLQIDGKDAGSFSPGTVHSIAVAPGSHEILAIPTGSAAATPWRKSVSVSSALASPVITIPLRLHLLGLDIQKAGYWSDSRTGFAWAGADSGSGVTVSQAHQYCRQLTTGGFHDWRLPAIGELQTLFSSSSATPDERGFRLVAPLRLTGWSWSATQGTEPAENWTLDLGDGARASVAAGDAGLNRALCVRTETPVRN
jgi:hypothetical protein